MAGLPHGFPKSPPSPVPEGDEEVSPFHDERFKDCPQASEVLSGESTDCNCSKTSMSSSQGGSRIETLQTRARSAGCKLSTRGSWHLGVLAAACGKSGTAAFRSRTPRFQAQRRGMPSQAPRAPLREVNARCEALYLEGRCRQLRREQGNGKENGKENDKEHQDALVEKGKPSKAWAEEVLRRHQQKLSHREEQRRWKAEQRAEEDLKECSFAPKLVARSHVQLQVNKGRRQLQHLAERQQEILLRLDLVGKEVYVEPAHRPYAARMGSRSLLLDELAKVDDEAHCVIGSLVKMGIPQVVEEPDPSTLCPDYDSGLLRRLQMEDAWGFKEPPIRAAGPLPPHV